MSASQVAPGACPCARRLPSVAAIRGAIRRPRAPRHRPRESLPAKPSRPDGTVGVSFSAAPGADDIPTRSRSAPGTARIPAKAACSSPSAPSSPARCKRPATDQPYPPSPSSPASARRCPATSPQPPPSVQRTPAAPPLLVLQRIPTPRQLLHHTLLIAITTARYGRRFQRARSVGRGLKAVHPRGRYANGNKYRNDCDLGLLESERWGSQCS